MKKLVLAAAVLVLGLGGTANASRLASTAELRTVTATLNDLRAHGADLATPTVVVLSDAEGIQQLGLAPKDWYAASYENVMYLHDSRVKSIDSQAHFRALGLILGDRNRRSRRLRTEACEYCNYALGTSFHELVHFGHDSSSRPSLAFEEGLASAIAADRTPAFAATALNARWFDEAINPTYDDYTTAVRNQSARATHTPWNSPRSRAWRISRLNDPPPEG